MAEKDFGLVLNTVQGQRCPDCRARGAMTIHPAHRVYPTCRHAFPLPPIGMASPYGKKRADVKTKGARK